MKLSYKTGSSGYVLDLTSISFKLPQCSALIGSSGSGKSTLVKALAGPWHDLKLVDANKGEDVSGIQSMLGVPARVIAVSQDPLQNCIPWLTLSAHADLIKKSSCIQQSHDFIGHLNKLGIDYASNSGKRIAEFSGGQQRRIVIALSLAFEPGLLIIDEALGSLDWQISKIAMTYLTELSIRKSTHILVVSHDIYLVGDFFSSVIYVKDRRLHMLERKSLSQTSWTNQLAEIY